MVTGSWLQKPGKGHVWIRLLEKNSERWLRDSDREVSHADTALLPAPLISCPSAPLEEPRQRAQNIVHACPPLGSE